MDSLWKGRIEKGLDQLGKNFNDSISFDSLMYREDIIGSIAHAKMLGATGIITSEESEKIVTNLKQIKNDIDTGKLSIDYTAEDIHTFVEMELTKRIGDIGKKLHTARGRNDQSALDLRLYLRKKVTEIQNNIINLVAAITFIAKEHKETIMPGFTHLQVAQPTTLAHHLLAYNAMLLRDFERFCRCYDNINISPLGACAMVGTTFPIDRDFTTKELGFSEPAWNSMDAVSSRDHVIELASACSIIIMHLSRFCEDIILWNNQNFNFITLDDQYSTGSSIMPQKKNPDLAELIRGKTGRVFGNNMALLTLMKGLPQSYNKDMQEDKEPIFDSLDTVINALAIMAPMLKTAKFDKEAMLKSAKHGFINATDCCDYLVSRGVAFRDAYKLVGSLVADCVNRNITLEELTLEEYKSLSPYFDKGVFDAIKLENCVGKRNSYGGPSSEAVQKQIDICEEFVKRNGNSTKPSHSDLNQSQ